MNAEKKIDKKYVETPLMKQYYSIKAVHPDAILLFRVGDFYETFGEDAIKASGILGITLTRRANGSATYVELAGFPYHAIDTYLPSFADIGASLSATPIEVQQTLTAYMLPFALMSLWHGAIADALGRRRVLLVSLALFALASAGCVFATRIEHLWVLRALQGISAGAGIVVSRAIVRDLYDGPEAQRLMSHISMMFALAPAIAPVIGGRLQQWFGWQSVFAPASTSSSGRISCRLPPKKGSFMLMPSTRPLRLRFMKNVCTRSSALWPRARWVTPYWAHSSNRRLRRSQEQRKQADLRRFFSEYASGP